MQNKGTTLSVAFILSAILISLGYQYTHQTLSYTPISVLTPTGGEGNISLDNFRQSLDRLEAPTSYNTSSYGLIQEDESIHLVVDTQRQK